MLSCVSQDEYSPATPKGTIDRQLLTGLLVTVR